MPSSSNGDLREEVESILKVWNANPEFRLKDVTLESFQAAADSFLKVLGEIDRHEELLMPLRNQRDDQAVLLTALCTRTRAGIRGYFGENSSEYEAVGGTRTSERKRSGRRMVPAPLPATPATTSPATP